MFASSLLIVLRMYVHNNDPTEPLSQNHTLIDVASIAIWNKNKIVSSTAFAIWGINGAFFLQRKLLLPYPTSDWELKSHTNVVWSQVSCG